ncbi:hypothetical protein LLG46_00505 [bacterium]|nr:hypothetical protein [bacterium]
MARKSSATKSCKQEACSLINADKINPQPEKTLTRYHLMILQAGKDDISSGLFDQVQNLLDRTIDTTPNETIIDVWLDSPGGIADAVYKLVLELRNRCVKLRTVISDYAKSAATLLALGTDEIFMAPAAELGPLDVQVGHPDREGVRISGLDVRDSLASLGRTAIDLVVQGGATIISYTGLPRHEVLHETLQFMAQFLQPVMSKLDPHLLHQAESQIKIAEHYALRMLRARNITEDKYINEDRARALLRHLVHDYPAHGFVIGRDEALELGLPIQNAECYDRWQEVRALYMMFRQKNQTIIDVCRDTDLDKNITEEETDNGSDTAEEANTDNKG